MYYTLLELKIYLIMTSDDVETSYFSVNLYLKKFFFQDFFFQDFFFTTEKENTTLKFRMLLLRRNESLSSKGSVECWK